MRCSLLALALVACSPAAPPTAPTAPAPAPVEAPPAPPVAAAPRRSPFPVGPGEEASRTVRSQRFQLSFPLPDRAGWAIDPEPGSSFLAMSHAATRSKLVVRRWRERGPMNRDRCEEAARLVRDLPEREGQLASSALEVPPGHDTRVDVGASGPPTEPRGWLLAFGARGLRCFAFVYTTEASGPDAEREVADRLAVMQTLVLERLVVHLDTEIAPRRAP